MHNLYQNAINKNWIIKDNNLCDQHHHVLVHNINQYLNQNQILEINQKNWLLNAIHYSYLQPGIYIKIPFQNTHNKQNGIYHWYLIKNDEIGLYTNHFFIEYDNDQDTYHSNLNDNKIELDNNIIYFNQIKNNDKLNNIKIGACLSRYFQPINKHVVYNHVNYQEMTLEEFMSQSLKILKMFVEFDKNINQIPKFNFMINWDEKNLH